MLLTTEPLLSSAHVSGDIPDTDCIQIAPFALLRVAGLPYSTLSALRPARSSSLIDTLAQLYRSQDSVRPLLEVALYEVVPKLPDPNARRFALNLRRAVHTGRGGADASPHVQTVSSLLSADAQQALSDWLSSSREIESQRRELDRLLPLELSDSVRPLMNQVFAGEHFRRGIGIASPGLREALDHAPKPIQDPFALSKTDRSMLRYAIRASSKTTPFSTFMSVAHLPVRRPGRSAETTFSGQHYHYRVTLNRGVSARIHKEAFRACAGNLNSPFSLNSSIQRLGPGRIRALLSQYSIMNGRPWRHDRYSILNLHESLTDVLLESHGAQTLAELLVRIQQAGLSSAQAAAFLGKCIDRGLILPPVAVDAFVPWAASSVAGQLAQTPELQTVAANLRSMEESVRSAVQGDGQFIRSERRIRDLEQQTLQALQSKTTEAFQSVITEDCWLSGVTGHVEKPIQELLQQVGGFLKSQAAFKDTYVYLRELFLKEFGPDGVCENAQDFLLDATNRVDAWRQSTADRLLDPVLTRPRQGVRVGLTAYVQPVHLSADRMESRSLVVNTVHEGIGWLAARLANEEDREHQVLAGSVRQWLTEAVFPAEPLEITISGECNGLQSHCQLTPRVLNWPGEPLLPGRPSVALRDLRISYNPETQLLQLADPQGKPIGLVYLGTVVPMPNWGLPFLLTTLAQPCYFKRPKINTPPLDSQSGDAVLRPRFMHRDLVLVRATWWIRTSRIREKWLGNKGAQRLVDTALDCLSLDLPSRFFARSHQAADTDIGEMPLDSRKPFWIDTRSPFCLTLLERMVEEGEWLILTEVLPGTNGLFTEIESEPHISELHVEMMIEI